MEKNPAIYILDKNKTSKEVLMSFLVDLGFNNINDSVSYESVLNEPNLTSSLVFLDISDGFELYEGLIEKINSKTDKIIVTSDNFSTDIIIKMIRCGAKDFLPKRVDFWAKKYNLDFSEINIKNMTSRWGSCSSLGAITLNLHLMRLPLELIDYVILHELAHLKHHNHSERFWTFLDKICPESDVFNKKLKFYKVDFLI